MIRYAAMFLLETWDFLAQIKSVVKLVKDIFNVLLLM